MALQPADLAVIAASGTFRPAYGRITTVFRTTGARLARIVLRIAVVDLQMARILECGQHGIRTGQRIRQCCTREIVLLRVPLLHFGAAFE